MKSIPQLRFPEFTDEWQVKRLGDIMQIIDGDRGTNYPSKSEFSNNGYCVFLSAENVTKDGFNFNNTVFITKERDRLMGKGKLIRDDLVLTTRGSVGHFSYYDNNIPYNNIRINSGMVLLRINNYILSNFLYKQSSSPLITTQIKRLAFGSAQPQLTVKTVGKLKISIPSKFEQQKIAGFLTAVDEKIAMIDKKVQLLKKYKNGVMQKIFSQKIRFKPEDGGDYPDWEEKYFCDVLENIAIKPYQIQSLEYKKSGSFPIVDQGKTNIVGYSNQDDKVFKKVPVIVFGDHTTILKFINFDFIVGADGVKIIRAKHDNNIHYLYFYLQQNQIKPEGYKRHFRILSKIKISLPSKEEQRKISDFLTQLDKKIEAEDIRLDSTKKWKEGLLQRMFV